MSSLPMTIAKWWRENNLPYFVCGPFKNCFCGSYGHLSLIRNEGIRDNFLALVLKNWQLRNPGF